MPWKLKILAAISVVVPCLIGLLLWDEARKEVYFLCENFEPGHTRADVIRQLDTATYLQLASQQHNWGESITVNSDFGPLTRSCHIEFNQDQQVRFAAVSPFHIQRGTLAGHQLHWAGQALQTLEANQITLSGEAEVVERLEAGRGMVLVSLNRATPNNLRTLRSKIEDEYAGEVRRTQLRRILVLYPELCLLPPADSKMVATYAKDNFAALAWSQSAQCTSDQQRWLDHQVESVFRHF